MLLILVVNCTTHTRFRCGEHGGADVLRHHDRDMGAGAAVGDLEEMRTSTRTALCIGGTGVSGHLTVAGLVERAGT